MKMLENLAFLVLGMFIGLRTAGALTKAATEAEKP